jgi:hypothetical protein
VDAEERSRLVASWIEHHTVEYRWDDDHVLRKERGADQFWAWEKLEEIVRNDPALGWDVILQIVSESNNESVLGNLAAGPLEDLIAWHGAKFIERVEAQARRDNRFREVLAGVWQNETPHDVWARVQACFRSEV